MTRTNAAGTSDDSIVKAAFVAAQGFFPELAGFSVVVSDAPAADTPPAKSVSIERASIESLSEADIASLVHRACALSVWRRSQTWIDTSAARLEKVRDEELRKRLVDTISTTEEFGQLLLLLERGRAPADADADLVELDRIANSAAMDFCDWQNWFEVASDSAVERILVPCAECTHELFQRYVPLRCKARSVPIGGHGAEPLAATIGLEHLMHHEEFRFVAKLFDADGRRPADGREGRVEIAIKVDAAQLHWPEDDECERGAGNMNFVDLSRVTWSEARDVLRSEKEMLEALAPFIAEGIPLIDLPVEELEDVDDIALADLGPTDFGTCAATYALNAAGCPTVSACAGHVEGYPYVAFWARPAWITLLSEAAAAANVGLGNASHGSAEVFTNADDHWGLLRFATELEKRSDQFATMQ